MVHLIIFAVLLMALTLFVWGRIRHDFVALATLLILTIFGIVEPGKAFVGFGHPAVITVAAILVISKGLEYSGVADILSRWAMRTGKHPVQQIFILSLAVAAISAFMNNIGALAIGMPIGLHLARKNGYPPSYILMPLAFASLLGGMTTLIGTPSNLIVSSFRKEETGVPFGMFEYAPVGIAVTLSGVSLIALIARKVLPYRTASKEETNLFNIEEYITEVEIMPKSKAEGRSIAEWPLISKTKVQILGLVRAHRHIHAPDPEETLLAGDILILETDAEDLKTVIANTGVRLLGEKPSPDDTEGAKNIIIAEAVVMAGSALANQTLADVGLRRKYGINLLALARKTHKVRWRLDQITFQPGDVLLLQGRERNLYENMATLGCLPLAKRNLRLQQPTQVFKAISIFAAAILIVAAGLLPVEVAFAIAALVMTLTGIVPVKDVYTAIDWPVIVLLGAMIPVGGALETSGGAALIASLVLEWGQYLPHWGILALVMVMTMCVSDVVNNAATVVLMAPIATDIAQRLGLSVVPFLVAVAIGGSSAFLTPIGHQSNTLVMGPGGYKFSDYWRLGLPLEILIVLISIPIILYCWPLHG